nr:alpha/beta hydrolase [Mycolicibacterium komanii]
MDEGHRTSVEERKFLRRVNRLENALRKAAADAKRADVDGPLLLAFDPTEFGGDGRAVVSFGHDPYQSDSVSWHAPGVQTTTHSLFGFYTGNALNHLQSVQQESPTLKAASIAWIGYETPSGRGLGRMLRQTAARTGGDVLYSDIRAFNAGRDAWAGDGSHFTGNHVFGYSYGSTTTAYAGRDGRLANHISTVSLIGSPGAGPLRHASEFGPGVDVYAASSSRDIVTALGGRTDGATSRFLGTLSRALGMGIDPAMASFGAERVAAEFPDGRNLPLTGGTHHAYYLHADTAGATRSESGANFGRIAAGHPERLQLEHHRTADGRNTVEPAAERAGRRRPWNPLWAPLPNCAVAVADELSTTFGRDIRLDVRPSRRGVPARELFQALGLDAQFATYADVEATLRNRPDGTTAVLVSRWSGGRSGGHAYLARNVDGEIQLIDPHTGERSGWPPHWGQDAVDVTAVGYLTASGEPMGHTNVDVPLRLDAADAVGRVRGAPSHADFSRRQAAYRAQDPAARQVDTRYADTLADVVDRAGDKASAQRLAADLSGRYGPYRITFEADRFGSQVLLTGTIIHDGQKIGVVQRDFGRDAQGRLVAHHVGFEIRVKPDERRGQGFSKAVTAEFERLYLRSGVDRAELGTHDMGGSAWPPRGFTWNPDPGKLEASLHEVRDSAGRLRDRVSPQGQAVLDEILPRLRPDHPRLPEPIDLLDLKTAAEPDLGKRLLDGVGMHKTRPLHFVKYYDENSTVPKPAGLKGMLQRWFGFGGPRAAENCALGVAAELSRMYGIDIAVAAPRPRLGVTARALFSAAGTSAEFQTYVQVEETLRGMAPNSSAVLASRWAHNSGRSGGHAYLAVTDGQNVYLFDPETGKRTGWPPPWGQDAVTRTAVGYLDEHGQPVRPLHDVPLQLAAADRISHVQGTDPGPSAPPEAIRTLGLPNHARASLSDAEATTVYGEGEQRLRELADRLAGDRVDLRERARILSEHRNALKAWTRELMANRELADLLAARDTTETFDDLVAHNEAKGLVGEEIYETIIHKATHSGYAPGTLSDAETTQVYSKFEMALREINEQLDQDGVPVQDRARLLSDLRSSLRAWTRELMSNRAAAETLAGMERNPSFDDLVTRYESKGLTGDAVFEAIVDSAIRSHYAQGTLSNTETRTVYTTFELRMREVAQRLENDGVDLEERARTLYELRASLRSWTRTLMADRETAEQLVANEPNPSFEDLVARQRAKGRVGDEIYEAIIASATRSRPSVNASLGIDPENPPPLPPMRGVTGDDGGMEVGTDE